MPNHAEPNRAEPESWETTSYTVRRPGCTCWQDGIATYEEARDAHERAEQVVPGHRIYAEQRYVGDLPSLAGETRTVER